MLGGRSPVQQQVGARMCKRTTLIPLLVALPVPAVSPSLATAGHRRVGGRGRSVSAGRALLSVQLGKQAAEVEWPRVHRDLLAGPR